MPSGNKVVLCHWNNGGGWDAIEVSTSALNGHENHSRDIWPPVEGASDGQNWPELETIWLNECAVPARPSPEPTESGSNPPGSTSSASPTPSATLPDTGPGSALVMSLIGIALALLGIWLMSVAKRKRQP